MTAMTSNIMKVGAHLDDTRVLIRVWDDDSDIEQNVAKIVEGNLLGLPSQSRAHDVMVRALRPRFLSSGTDVVPALRVLSPHPNDFNDACYYELTRVDRLVATFAEEQLPEWWDEGRAAVSTSDARDWVEKLAADARIPDWSPNIRDRVARGMMAALRDMGRLTGRKSSPNKQLVRPGISVGGFAYVASRLRGDGLSSRALINAPEWRRWMLDEAMVVGMFNRLASLGIIYFATAGSSLRIDWRRDSLVEVVRAAV